jgi:signal transduction histidine kinase
MMMVYMSIAIGLIILLVHWQKFHINLFLIVSLAGIVMTVRLIQITGAQHNPFAHLFYPILLASAIYYRQNGAFSVLTAVLIAHTLCVAYGLKNDTTDEFLLTCFAYITVTWVTFLCKLTLMSLKEQSVAIEVAGGIAHELSQPLLVIEGTAAQLESKRAEDEYSSKAASTIRENAQRMQKSLQQLQKITEYRSKKYVAGMKIMDLEQSSKDHA